MIKAILFDFDGTLVDSTQLLLTVVKQLSDFPQFQQLDADTIKTLRSMGLKKALQELGVPLRKVPQLVTQSQALARKHSHTLELFPHWVEVIPQLAQQYQLGIVTSNTVKTVHTVLNRYNLAEFSIIEAEPALFGKHTKIKSVIKKLGFTVEEVLYVGDEIRDIESSQKVGCPMIGVSWGLNTKASLLAAGALQVIDHPRELLSLSLD